MLATIPNIWPRSGCRLQLADVSQRLPDAAAARLESAGLGSQVMGVSLRSATDLGPIPSGSFDAVLLLDPLYHLLELADRRRAVREAARLLRPGGCLYAAAINRLPYF